MIAFGPPTRSDLAFVSHVHRWSSWRAEIFGHLQNATHSYSHQQRRAPRSPDGRRSWYRQGAVFSNEMLPREGQVNGSS